MSEACKHKAAAASINWMVSLIKSKTGAEHTATKASLESMFHDMVEKNCIACAMNGDCHELDMVGKVLSERPAVSQDRQFAPVSTPGALVIRRMARRARLRPPVR